MNIYYIYIYIYILHTYILHIYILHNFPEEGRHFYRKSLQNLFLSTLLRVMKAKSTESTRDELVP